MNKILDNHNRLCRTSSDINEHLPVLKKYAEECKHITEFGVRWIVSTWSFLAANPSRMISYDIVHPRDFGARIETVEEAAREAGISFEFKLQSVLDADIEPTDLLFIDTYHIASQIKQELALNAGKVKKYIIFHDTTLFETMGENHVAGEGIWKEIESFLENNKKTWVLKERLTNNNGLTIIQRIA